MCMPVLSLTHQHICIAFNAFQPGRQLLVSCMAASDMCIAFGRWCLVVFCHCQVNFPVLVLCGPILQGVCSAILHLVQIAYAHSLSWGKWHITCGCREGAKTNGLGKTQYTKIHTGTSSVQKAQHLQDQVRMFVQLRHFESCQHCQLTVCRSNSLGNSRHNTMTWTVVVLMFASMHAQLKPSIHLGIAPHARDQASVPVVLHCAPLPVEAPACCMLVQFSSA